MPATLEQKFLIAHKRVLRLQAASGAADTWWVETEKFRECVRLKELLTAEQKATLLADWAATRAEAQAAAAALPPDDLGLWDPDPSELSRPE